MQRNDMGPFAGLVRLIGVLGFIASTLACKSLSNSNLKHDIGEVTTRSKPFTCVKESPVPDVADFYSYIYEHVKKIGSSNTALIPQEFQYENYCLKIEVTPIVNAYAQSDGTMGFLSGILKVIENDAQFAALVAHEMGHVLQGHGSERIPKEMENNPEYKKVFQKMAESHEAMLSLLKQSKESEKDATDKMRPIEPLTTNYANIVSAYAKALGQDPYTASGQDFYQNIVMEPFSPSFKGASDNYSKRSNWPAPTLKGMAQDARRKILALDDKKLVSDFLSIEKVFLQNLSSVVTLVTKRREGEERAKALMALQTGLARASNWEEQEADEVGFELYLRAGYDYREFMKMFENMENFFRTSPAGSSPSGTASDDSRIMKSASGDVAVSVLGDEIRGTSCVRGTSSHPARCWRIANLKNEWEIHQDFYSRIAPMEPLIHVYGDRLQKVKERMKSAKPSREGQWGSSQPERTSPGEKPNSQWCDPYKPSQCYPYCQSMSSDDDLSGWGSEDGKTCVIKNGPIDKKR